MELRKGIDNDRSGVVELQTLLNQKGFVCSVDGIFGDGTERCVCAAQKTFGLIPNGIANDIFLSVLKKSLVLGSVTPPPVQLLSYQDVKRVQAAVNSTLGGLLTADILKQSMPYASDFNIQRFL